MTYCGAECQRADWKRHKPDCRKGTYAGSAKAPRSAPTPMPERRPELLVAPEPTRRSELASAHKTESTADFGGGGGWMAREDQSLRGSVGDQGCALEGTSPLGGLPHPRGAIGAASGAGTRKKEAAEMDNDKPSFVTTSPTRSVSGTPGTPACYDVILSGQRSMANAQLVVDKLMERGVCVVKAGAEKGLQKLLHIESRLLWDSGEFMEAKKGKPIVPGSEQIQYDSRDDKVVWMTSAWHEKFEKKCKALKVLDGLLGDFGFGLKHLLENQLGLEIRQRTCSMLSCYAGDEVPGARYDFHVDNPFQTSMRVPDDKRRLTVIYYISDGAWDVHKDGGALQVCLTNPRRALATTGEAITAPQLTVAPECDTLAIFFSHTMYHAVLPVTSNRKRFALSTWFTIGSTC